MPQHLIIDGTGVPPSRGPWSRKLILTLFLLCVAARLAIAQRPAAPIRDPVAPYTPEAAARAVDRFIAAFNAGDTSGLEAAFAPPATAFTFDKDNQFKAVSWLPHPWSYHQLQANQLDFRAGGWRVVTENRAALSVLERLVSASFVAQRERITSSAGHTLYQMVHYQISNGRILHLWIFPFEELDVPHVARPRHPLGSGPVIWFDAGHGNLDTPDGSYYRFAELLRRDGYTVRTWEAPFTRHALDSIRILVIVNAQPARGTDSVPSVPPRSAFAPAEERALEEWVAAGGALLLVADHQPMAGAAASLAARFGAEFHNGIARDSARSGGGGDVFQRSDGSLRPHVITDASGSQSQIDSVVTFLGQAFQASRDIQPLLVLPGTMVLTEPAAGGQPQRRTPVGGWLQGGIRRSGKGRVALFGEAWMFRFFDRAQNAEFLRNLMNWLGRVP